MGADGWEKSAGELAEGGGYETLETYVFLHIIFQYETNLLEVMRGILPDVFWETY